MEILEEGQAPSSSGISHVVDPSVSLKRACEAEFATPATPLSGSPGIGRILGSPERSLVVARAVTVYLFPRLRVGILGFRRSFFPPLGTFLPPLGSLEFTSFVLVYTFSLMTHNGYQSYHS